jgi:hypothetical protein
MVSCRAEVLHHCPGNVARFKANDRQRAHWSTTHPTSCHLTCCLQRPAAVYTRAHTRCSATTSSCLQAALHVLFLAAHAEHLLNPRPLAYQTSTHAHHPNTTSNPYSPHPAVAQPHSTAAAATHACPNTCAKCVERVSPAACTVAALPAKPPGTSHCCLQQAAAVYVRPDKLHVLQVVVHVITQPHSTPAAAAGADACSFTRPARRSPCRASPAPCR